MIQFRVHLVIWTTVKFFVKVQRSFLTEVWVTISLYKSLKQFYFILFSPLITIQFIYLFIYFLTCVPKHEPPSHLPPHNISLGHPCAPAPSMLYPTSDIDWRFEYNWIKEIKYAIAFYLNSLLTVFLFSFIVTNLIVFVKI